MNPVVKLKRILLLVGDILILYISMVIMLLVRYGSLSDAIARSHYKPFSILFILWILVSYIGDLYELSVLKNNIDFTKRLAIVLGINGLVAVLFFYFLPGASIAPKTNLFLFLFIVGILDTLWRKSYNTFMVRTVPATRILAIGYNQTFEEAARFASRHPQLGYEITTWMKEGLHDKQFAHLTNMIAAHRITMIVVPAHIKKSPRAAKLIYKNLASGIRVVDLAEFYEMLFKKVPLAELEEVWFLDNLITTHRIYDTIKRPLEIVIVALFLMLTLPLTLLIALMILLTSGWPILFSQTRTGLGGKEFVLQKFRTMRRDAEALGPQWASKDDTRTTPFGKFLRRTHLDEFPQLINVLKGSVALIGPRPERPEFVRMLEREIPYYELRHIIRPGITGWAQTHYRYGASVEDAYEKLQYDIYYLKHRSLFLDAVILLKTVKFFFTNL